MTTEAAKIQVQEHEKAAAAINYFDKDGSYIIAEYLGGSHLYGLNTPESDVDIRGIFVNTDPKFILGTGRFEELRKQDHKLKEDIVYKEVSHLMRLLQNSNSEALEVLFADDSAFTTKAYEFNLIRAVRHSLVDSERLYKCLRGYMQGEYRLAIGERKGQIGGKRYAKLQEVGFSPKNFTQLFRLAYLGATFFLQDRFVVNVSGEPYFEQLMSIKTTPEKHTKESLTEMYKRAEQSLDDAFKLRVVDRKFDEKLANELLLNIYRKHLGA